MCGTDDKSAKGLDAAERSDHPLNRRGAIYPWLWKESHLHGSRRESANHWFMTCISVGTRVDGVRGAHFVQQTTGNRVEPHSSCSMRVKLPLKQGARGYPGTSGSDEHVVLRDIVSLQYRIHQEPSSRDRSRAIAVELKIVLTSDMVWRPLTPSVPFWGARLALASLVHEWTRLGLPMNDCNNRNWGLLRAAPEVAAVVLQKLHNSPRAVVQGI